MRKTNYPRGAISAAARRLGLNRCTVYEAITLPNRTTERTLEILRVVEECSDAIYQERRMVNSLRGSIQSKYAAN